MTAIDVLRLVLYRSLAVGGIAGFVWAADNGARQSTPVVVKSQGYVPFAEPPINYRSQALDDPIARLEKRLESGDVKLRYDSKYGYLRAVLDALDIPADSQTLVFSKTSFQFPNIAPAKPRALYFNDDVYVGRVQEGKFLEFVSFDPMQGAIFYVMDEKQSQQPRFERAEVDCVQCHVAASTRGVPGVMLRSVHTKASGAQAPATPAFITGQESPLNQRWGGWYVTAKGGAGTHLGNAVDGNERSATTPSTVERLLDAGAYLTNTSDIVALLVLAHQTQMHNRITETNYRTRLAIHADEKRNKAASNSAGSELSVAAKQQIEAPAEELVRYLLFTNEATLVGGPVAGRSDFARDFAARGPRDSIGRSLREFDLRTRIFKYPCSYLVYSQDFDAIPAPAKQYIYQRLFDVLSGRDQSPEFASLSSEDRRAVLEILADTKSDLPEEWKQFAHKPGARNSIVSTTARLKPTAVNQKGNYEQSK